jgi:polyisoprenoid-binding protein YceI
MKFTTKLFTVLFTAIIAMPMIAADTYKIDPAHTGITFSVRHLGINNVKGRFKDFAGTVTLDGKVIKEANGTIQVASIDTEVQQRDDHLRSPDFFDAAKHPTITFKTKRVERSGEQSVLIADFTMRGVTKEIRLPVKITDPVKDQTGAIRIGLQTKAKLNRKDYGIAYSQTLETGVAMVGEEVEIEIDAEAIKQG